MEYQFEVLDEKGVNYYADGVDGIQNFRCGSRITSVDVSKQFVSLGGLRHMVELGRVKLVDGELPAESEGLDSSNKKMPKEKRRAKADDEVEIEE